MSHLGRSFDRAKRHKDYLFAVLFLDLDRFKVINDSLGHLMGDELLISVSQRLSACLRSIDTVARLGGDEFAILLDDTTDGTSAVRIAERIQASLARPFPVGGSEVFTTASIGIVDATDEQESPEHFLRDADTAMYRAKKLGGGRHQVFDTSMHARAVELLKLETDLRRALERQELSLAYQPIVSLEDGRILGVEALMRWRHAERELVLPSEFIPLAEETGLISEIGEWALHAACAQAHAWRQAGLPRIYVSVNLSAQQFRHRDLAGVISRVLEETGLESSGLQLELTESCVMDHAEQTISTLRSLREVGVQLAVDDFGTGYSSLRYLRRFPIQALKIDQYFVRGIGVHPDDESIAGAIMALGNVLHLAVIAEGVETDAQLQFLRDQGCHAIQGSLFSTALPPDEVEALLRDDIRLPAADAAAILRRSAG
jgi:diguanylate cyclase (GGDEF)-like protein